MLYPLPLFFTLSTFRLSVKYVRGLNPAPKANALTLANSNLDRERTITCQECGCAASHRAIDTPEYANLRIKGRRSYDDLRNADRARPITLPDIK